MQDPRTKNFVIEGSPSEFLAVYADTLQLSLKRVDTAALDEAIKAIEAVGSSGRTIYVAGNGGSAAIGDHLCCDWTKGTDHPDHPSIKSISFGSNVALFSAIANDFGYELVFSKQVKYFGLRGDVLIAISSSGNSPNIINAVKAAKELGLITIGLSGFDGGELKTLVDISLHVPVQNYGLVEDCHQSIMHVMAQYIYRKRATGC